MPPPTPAPVRQHLLRMHRQGLTIAQAAERAGVPERTARRLIRRAAAGGPGLEARYDTAPHHSCPLPDDLRRQAADLADRHPGWGADYLLLRLRERHPDTPWPAARTLRRWAAAAGRPAAPPGRKPAGRPPRAAWPHDVWQVDAADQLPLAGGREVSWLRAADECSGAFLHTRVFSPRPLQPGAAGGGPGGADALLRPLGAAAGGAGR